MNPLESMTSCLRWLNQFNHHDLPPDWAQTSLMTLKKDKVQIRLPFACADLAAELVVWAQSYGVEVTVDIAVAAMKTELNQPVPPIKNIIAVSSGKGGVGKSTTAVNLALGLQAQGACVGLLDADIYGPSLPLMLGVADHKVASADNKTMQPIMVKGIAVNSIGFLIDDQDAAVWRGPMASKALLQLLRETAWPQLDYLIVDLPPGTGDIQLTLAQQIPVTGAVVVTTPQDLALADVRKGVNMFDKVNVPVIGVIENMSYHTCEACGHQSAIFGHGGADKLTQEMGLSLLAKLPLAMPLRECMDAGMPPEWVTTENDFSSRYRALAQSVSSKIYWTGQPKPEQIDVVSL